VIKRASSAIALGAALSLTLAAPSPLPAQSSWFRLGVEFVGEWNPAVTLGVLIKKPLGGAPALPSGDAPVEADARGWDLSGMLVAGVTWANAAGNTPAFTAGLQLGALYRLSPTTRLGAYALGNVGPDGYGGVIRYEPMSQLGAQLGYIRLTAVNRNGLYGSIDVSVGLLADATRSLFH
jgi:hypothetical protein